MVCYGISGVVNINIRTEAHVPKPYGHKLTHAHNHITPAVTAMDSCLAPIGPIGAHQKPEKGTPFVRSLPV